MSLSGSESSSLSASISLSERLSDNTVKLRVYNEVLDVNGLVALNDGQVFNIYIRNDQFETLVSLKRGESVDVLLPKGVYTAHVEGEELAGRYEYIALLGPDGIQRDRQVDLTNEDDANITLINRVSGAPTIAGGYFQAVKYVVEGGVLLAPADAVFSLNVEGSRIVDLDYEPASDGNALEGGQALPDGNRDGNKPDAGEVLPADIATPNGIGIVWDSGTDGGKGISGDSGVEALADTAVPYQSVQGVAQGRPVMFATGRGTFEITELLAENIGYELASICRYDENTTDLSAAPARSLAFEVLDSVGTVAIVLNKVVPIIPPPPPVIVNPDDGIDRSFGGDPAPIAVAELPDDSLPGGAAIQEHIQYIFGYPDGTVKPDSSITRAETAAILFRLMAVEDDISQLVESSYTDVNAGDWYVQIIEYLTAVDILDGYPDGTFRPNDPITRAEFAKMIVGAEGLDATAANAFSDVAGHWAAGYANSAAANGWFIGYSDGTFGPQNYLTRAETVAAMNRVYDREIAPENIPGYAPRYADLPLSHWAYAAITEASITHYCDRLGDGTEIWVDPNDYVIEEPTDGDAEEGVAEDALGESDASAAAGLGANGGALGESDVSTAEAASEIDEPVWD
jgi:hypothetical protein